MAVDNLELLIAFLPIKVLALFLRYVIIPNAMYDLAVHRIDFNISFMKPFMNMIARFGSIRI